MGNKISFWALIIIAVFSCAMIWAGDFIGFNASKSIKERQVTDFKVISLNNKYDINNNEIHVVYTDNLVFAKRDFCIMVYFDNNTTLQVTDDFEFASNINGDVQVGEYLLVFKYKGLTKEISLFVENLIIDKENLIIDKVPDYTYTGIEIKPKIKINYKDIMLFEDIDFATTYLNNIDAGCAEILVNGRGKYNFETKITFNILPKTLEIGEWSYSGEYVYSSADYEVKLNYIPYELNVEYENNIKRDVGDYFAKAKFSLKPEYNANNYAFCKNDVLNWKIIKRSLLACEINSINSTVYTGEDIRPNVEVSLYNRVLVQGIDYQLCFNNNKNVTTAAEIVIIGIGNYCEQKIKLFEIKAKEVIVKNVWNYPTDGYTYDGKQKSVNMVQVNDMVVLTYKNNIAIDAGSYQAEAKLNLKEEYKNNYTLTLKNAYYDWRIEKANLLDVNVTSIPKQMYTGNEIKPVIDAKFNIYNSLTGMLDTVLTLQENIDYKLTYINNINIGTAVICIEGIGNYTNKIYKTFEIEERSWPISTLSNFNISLEKPQGSVVLLVEESNDCLVITLGQVTEQNFIEMVQYLYDNDMFAYNYMSSYVDIGELIVIDDYTCAFSAKNSETEEYIECNITYMSKDYFEHRKNTMIIKFEKSNNG